MFKQKQGKGQNFQDACVSVVQAGDLQALKNLLSGQGKIDIDTPIGRLGLTFLHLTAIFGEIRLASWLLENRAKIDKQESSSGKTPLHLAAYYGHVDLLDLFLRYSKKTMTDNAGCLPIHYACMRESIEGVRLLIKRGDKVNHFSEIGTPLDVAVRKKNFQIADFLSSNIGTPCLMDDIVGSRRRGFCTPIHLAIASEQKELAEMLLQKFPQFPSENLRKNWEWGDFSSRFFSYAERRDYLRLFYLPEEIPEVVEKINRYLENSSRGSLDLDPSLKGLFVAIEKGDLEGVRQTVQHHGIKALNQGLKKIPWKEDGPLFTPVDRAEELYFFTFFEWLIEERIFGDWTEDLGFFLRWILMEIDHSAGGFFKLIPRSLEVLNLRYHVMKE